VKKTNIGGNSRHLLNGGIGHGGGGINCFQYCATKKSLRVGERENALVGRGEKATCRGDRSKNDKPKAESRMTVKSGQKSSNFKCKVRLIHKIEKREMKEEEMGWSTARLRNAKDGEKKGGAFKHWKEGEGEEISQPPKKKRKERVRKRKESKCAGRGTEIEVKKGRGDLATWRDSAPGGAKEGSAKTKRKMGHDKRTGNPTIS